MSETLSEEQIDKAVDWWVATLSLKPKFDALGPTRGRDAQETLSCDFAAVMQSQAAARDRQGMKPDALERFAQALRQNLAGHPEAIYGLHCDYGPGKILSYAAAAADVPDSLFPWKTHMRFTDGQVYVSHGYGAEEQRL